MSIPVVRAESFYLPPPELAAEAWDLVPPAERVWRWVEYRQQRRAIPPEGVLLGERVWARINHGRWISDCVCGSAQIVTPADPRMACTECGWGWVQVAFPEDPATVESAVEVEPPHLRNWTHPNAPGMAGPPPPPPGKTRPQPPAEPPTEGI
ncbi:hypothetical protein ABZ135_36510 [Streptomyces sp. NPDC006339]|uniref:hypothetical protein n=1 Tax=Streptomyces sp. NPDC006339 TaxID=3156755 RepID=UPI0033AB6316